MNSQHRLLSLMVPFTPSSMITLAKERSALDGYCTSLLKVRRQRVWKLPPHYCVSSRYEAKIWCRILPLEMRRGCPCLSLLARCRTWPRWVRQTHDIQAWAQFWEGSLHLFLHYGGYPAPTTNATRKNGHWQLLCRVSPPPCVKGFPEKRPHCKLRIHHDNAPAHRSAIVGDCLEDNNVVLVPHPPYSPDLAPCVFWLFPILKNHLCGTHYTSRHALVSAISQCLSHTPQTDFALFPAMEAPAREVCWVS
jgi:hypothetical protein